MGNPSAAVKPIVVATLLPALSPHMLAPFPRCATMTRPEAAFGSNSGSTLGDVLVRQAMKAVASYALLSDRGWQRERLSNLILCAMESCIKACNLR